MLFITHTNTKLMYKYLILLILIASCTTSEKIAQKALADPIAFGKVGEVYRRLNPCLNDTSVITKTDTIETVHADTAYIKTTVFQNGTNSTDTIYREITKYITRNIHDTAKYYTRDKTAERLLTDSFIYYKNLFFQEHGNTTDAIKEKKRWQINFWLLLIATISISFLGIYLKFKTKIL